MTNRQSNIIFYSLISLFLIGVITNAVFPQFFERFTKTEQELQIQQAMEKAEYDKALAVYSELVAANINQDQENTMPTAALYEEMAKIYALQDNQAQERAYYLKSLPIRKTFQEKDRYSLARIYHQLGLLDVQEDRLNKAQSNFEISLLTRLGDEQSSDQDKGMFLSLMQQRIDYKRLNHSETVATFRQLAGVHEIKKEYKLAREYYTRALSVSKEVFGEESSQVADIERVISKLTEVSQ